MNKKYTDRELLAQEILFHPEIYPGMIRRNSDEIIFLLWRSDGLGDYMTWSLFKSDNNKHYVRRVIWKQRAPYKLKKPETIAAECLISQEMAYSIMQGLPNLNCDIDSPYDDERSNLIIDGTEYGVKMGSNQISWQGALSQRLVELTKWYEKTLCQFEKLFC